MKKTKPKSERSPEIEEALDALERLEVYLDAKKKKIQIIQERTDEDPYFSEEIPTGVVAMTQLNQNG